MTLENPADFNAIAEHDDAEQTIKVATYEMKLQLRLTDICIQLLTIFLLAAVHGTNKAKYINTIQNKLDLTSQNEIASVIQRVNPKSSTPNAAADISIRRKQPRRIRMRKPLTKHFLTRYTKTSNSLSKRNMLSYLLRTAT